MARQKTVHPPNMVAHLWANQSQDEARNPGDTFYFDGDTIYSYGAHFPIACHVKTKRGKVVLFTTQSYSVSTNRHIHMADGACSHLTVFYVHDPTETDRRKQFNEYRDRLKSAMRSYVRARSQRPWWKKQMAKTVKEANDFAKFFGLRLRLKVLANAEVMEAECKAIDKRETAKRKRETAKRERERKEREREQVAILGNWVEGQSTPTQYFGDLPVRLRIRDGNLETSHGAVVPLKKAIKAYRIIKRLYDKGEPYQRNGHTIHIGQFPLDAVDVQGNVTAGCHTVEWSEIARIAELAGVG